MRCLAVLAALAASCSPLVSAANANEWRSRSIYQLITDRFAPPSPYAPARSSPLPAVCDPAQQTWCGGTWLSIIDKLDYIQGLGMDAIWISPVSQNIDFHTPYNYAYHGYWVNDPMSLNPRFGSAEDLKALSAALHARGMYLMVDIVVNNIPGISTNTSQSASALQSVGSRWTDPSQFHRQCWIDYNNVTSVEYCWLGDDKLPLMDVNTENPDVVSALTTWIADFVKTYGVDGLRIDAAKHVPGAFWTPFCKAAGVFCIGEVYGSDIGFAAEYQKQKWMDSILGFPLYYGIVRGFGTPNGNMSAFVDIANQVLTSFQDPGLLGNFIENHDLPRWRNTTVDPQLAYNAMVAQFVFDGIPVVYYGQEQDFGHGAADPYNRAALWPSNYTNTSTYGHIARLNQVRKSIISNNTQYNGQTYLNSTSKIIASTPFDVAIRKGPLLAVLTNRGSPPQNASFPIRQSGWPSQSSIVDVLSCKLFTVGADGTISVSYSAQGYGGMPYLFISQADSNNLNLCGTGSTSAIKNGTLNGPSSTSGALPLTAPVDPLLAVGVASLLAVALAFVSSSS